MFTLTACSPAVWILLSFSLRLLFFFNLKKKNVIMTVIKSAKSPSREATKKELKSSKYL